MKEAESKCRKLRMGQVEFSPTLQLARTRIYAWTLLSRRTSGQKVSSRLIQRVLKRAQLPPSSRGLAATECKDKLKEAHRVYFSTKKSAPELRATYLNSLAIARAQTENSTAAQMIKLLKHREQTRSSHKKIKFLRGKLERNSTTLVTVLDD
jgi:hypothetical protein